MAKKKKKQAGQHKQRQQKKQQRRAARLRKHPSTGSSPAGAPSVAPGALPAQSALLDDALSLFPTIAGVSSVHPEAAWENFAMAALDSADLIEEAEFDEIMPDPLTTSVLFMKYAEEMGYSADAYFDLEEEAREDAFWSILDKVIEEALTEELRHDILHAVDALRLRLKQTRRRKKDLPEVAALQMMLQLEGEEQAIWTDIGLVQAIFHRSVIAGFEMGSALLELEESGASDEESLHALLSSSEAPEGILNKIASRLEKVPGLGRFFDKQMDTIWDDGLYASFMGELDLGLYTDAEIEVGESIWTAAAERAAAETGLDVESEEDIAELVGETAKRSIEQIHEHVDSLFTPERFEQLAQRLEQARQEHARADSKWVPFILMIQQYVQEDSDYLLGSGYLIRAFMGELRNWDKE